MKTKAKKFQTLLIFMLLVLITSSCAGTKAAGNEAWSIVELLTKGERVDSFTDTIYVKNCNGGAENKEVSCSAGTTNDLNIGIGFDVGIGAGAEAHISPEISASLGIGRDSGETLGLETPAENFVYEYAIKKTYKVITGDALIRSSGGEEKTTNYAYQASCSLEIISQQEIQCSDISDATSQIHPNGNVYDDFNNSTFDNSIWYVYKDKSSNDTQVKQSNGVLSIYENKPQVGQGLILNLSNWNEKTFNTFEADVMIKKNEAGNITLNAESPSFTGGWTEFGIGEDNGRATIHIFMGNQTLKKINAEFDTWYALGITFDEEQNKITYFVDGQEVASSTISSSTILSLTPAIQFWHPSNSKGVYGYLDNVKIQ